MRRRERGRGAAHDRWLVSYADFMTLLFAFFTTMYAISTVDRDKLTPAASSLQVAFAGVTDAAVRKPAPMPTAPPEPPVNGGVVVPAVVPPAAPVVPAPPMPEPAAAAPLEGSLDDVRARLADSLAGAIQGGRVELISDPRGLVVSLPEGATFGVASADVTAEAQQVIQQVAGTVKPLGNRIRVEGHTDNVPIRTARYQSNWELSTARASAVVMFLVGAGTIEPERLSAAGYGEFHPRADNSTAAGRSRNRRVDVVILGPTRAAEEPGATGDRRDPPRL